MWAGSGAATIAGMRVGAKALVGGLWERAQRTHTEEFYEVWDLTWTVAEINRQLLAWEHVYNTVRPHQALGYRTPQQFLQESSLAGST